MTTHRTGSGEPSRTLALLWGALAPTPPHKGPARSLTVPQLVDAALDLADASGLGAVTVRAVAHRVGVSAMSVYTYVPGKPELLDLMVDTLYARATRPMWTTRSWRERIIAVAESNRALITAHPWLTEAALPSRPPLGPGVMAKYEHELAALDNTGLADVDVDAALGFVLGFVQAHCRWATDARSARAESQQSDAQWWAANAPLLARVLDPSRYPRAVRIGEAAGARQDSAWSDDHAWQFGLDRTLDGLAALIDRAG